MAQMRRLIIVMLLCFSSLAMSNNNPQMGLKRIVLLGKIQDLELDIDLLTYAIENTGKDGQKYLPRQLRSKQLILTDLKTELEEL